LIPKHPHIRRTGLGTRRTWKDPPVGRLSNLGILECVNCRWWRLLPLKKIVPHSLPTLSPCATRYHTTMLTHQHRIRSVRAMASATSPHRVERKKPRTRPSASSSVFAHPHELAPRQTLFELIVEDIMKALPLQPLQPAAWCVDFSGHHRLIPCIIWLRVSIQL